MVQSAFRVVETATAAPLEAAASLLWIEQEQLLTDLGPGLCPLHDVSGWIVRWHRGFVRSVACQDRPESATWYTKQHQRLFSAPAAALLTELSFEDAFLGDAHVASLLRVRGQLARIPVIKLEGNRFSSEACDRLRAAFPRATLSPPREGRT